MAGADRIDPRGCVPPTGAYNISVLLAQLSHEREVGRVPDVPDVPELGNRGEFRPREGRAPVEPQPVDGHAAEQGRQVRGRHGAERLEPLEGGLPPVRFSQAIPRESREHGMSGYDSRDPHVPLVPNEETMMSQDAHCGG